VGVYIGPLPRGRLSGAASAVRGDRARAPNLLEKGPGRISPFFIPATIVNLASGNVSIRTGAKGPNSATSTACTTSAHCIGDSYRLIQHGYADAMICGGAEACITPMGVGGFAAMRALSTGTTSRSAPPARGTATATASSSAKARAS
jgi:3-oxoacyl-(acyl-carrier-protein) synthase